MVIRLVIAIALAAAAAAGATTFLAEDFEGVWPPAGWYWWQSQGGGNGEWSQLMGPWGYCARGRAAAPVAAGVFIRLYSVPMYITAPVTLYYRFDYQRYRDGTQGWTYFDFNFLRGGSAILSRSLPTSGWTVHSGSVAANSAGEYRLEWVLTAVETANQSIYGFIDNVLISDQPFTAAAPMSLGRVKALYR